MNHEIVTLEEKTIVSLSARTNNSSPDMSSVIGGLWQKFYSPEVCPLIKNRTNEKAVGIYTEYSSDETEDYTVAVGCEVSGCNNIPGECRVIKIPAGKYAKFVVKGNMLTAVREFWQKLWEMDLPRSYVCDFEEYQNADPENAEIHIYISCKQ